MAWHFCALIHLDRSRWSITKLAKGPECRVIGNTGVQLALSRGRGIPPKQGLRSSSGCKTEPVLRT